MFTPAHRLLLYKKQCHLIILITLCSLFVPIFDRQVIVFDFQYIDIEPEHGNYSSFCPFDFLQIYDGRNSDDDYILRTYCATKEHGKLLD